MPLHGDELDRLANDIVDSTLTIYLHTAAPTGNLQNARITGASESMAPANWTTASDGSGDVQYDADIDFGVINSGSQTSISHYSIFRGNQPVASEAMSATITVEAGGTFKANTGTIVLNGSTS